MLDLAEGLGQFCSKLLADLGADVVKVEKPEGDDSRRWAPFKGDLPHPERSLYFEYYNTNKRGITLNLDTMEGRGMLRRLVERADALVESFPPGFLESKGLGYSSLREVNPRLVMASISGFGQSGVRSNYKAPEIVPFAMSGLMYISGEAEGQPTVAPGNQSYDIASIYAAAGILIALYHGFFSGSGQHVDVSCQECLALEEHNISRYTFDGHIVQREGSQHGAAAPGRIFPCKDGYFHIFVGGGAQEERWKTLLEWMGEPEVLGDAIWLDNTFRRENVDLINPYVRGWALKYSREELVKEGQERHLPTAPVHTPAEFVQSPHTQARGYFVEVEHPETGRHQFPGGAFRMSATPWRFARPAPSLGEHNLEIYEGELGFTREELALLRGAKVI